MTWGTIGLGDILGISSTSTLDQNMRFIYSPLNKINKYIQIGYPNDGYYSSSTSLNGTTSFRTRITDEYIDIMNESDFGYNRDLVTITPKSIYFQSPRVYLPIPETMLYDLNGIFFNQLPILTATTNYFESPVSVTTINITNLNVSRGITVGGKIQATGISVYSGGITTNSLTSTGLITTNFLNVTSGITVNSTITANQGIVTNSIYTNGNTGYSGTMLIKNANNQMTWGNIGLSDILTSTTVVTMTPYNVITLNLLSTTDRTNRSMSIGDPYGFLTNFSKTLDGITTFSAIYANEYIQLKNYTIGMGTRDEVYISQSVLRFRTPDALMLYGPYGIDYNNEQILTLTSVPGNNPISIIKVTNLSVSNGLTVDGYIQSNGLIIASGGITANGINTNNINTNSITSGIIFTPRLDVTNLNADGTIYAPKGINTIFINTDGSTGDSGTILCKDSTNKMSWRYIKLGDILTSSSDLKLDQSINFSMSSTSSRKDQYFNIGYPYNGIGSMSRTLDGNTTFLSTLRNDYMQIDNSSSNGDIRNSIYITESIIEFSKNNVSSNSYTQYTPYGIRYNSVPILTLTTENSSIISTINITNLNVNTGITSNGLIIANKGISVSGGLTVSSGIEVRNGISVYSGGITTNFLTSTGLITANGITVIGGLMVSSGIEVINGISVYSGGITTNSLTSTGLITANDGIIVTGGLTVSSGIEVRNGISVYSGGITTNLLYSTGLITSGGITVTGGITTNSIEATTFVITGRTHSPNTAIGINSSGDLDWISITSSGSSGLITANDGIIVTGGLTVSSGMEVRNGISVYSGGITTNSLTSSGLITTTNCIVTGGITTNSLTSSGLIKTNSIEASTFVITGRTQTPNTSIGINSNGQLDWIPITSSGVTSSGVGVFTARDGISTSSIIVNDINSELNIRPYSISSSNVFGGITNTMTIATSALEFLRKDGQTTTNNIRIDQSMLSMSSNLGGNSSSAFFQPNTLQINGNLSNIYNIYKTVFYTAIFGGNISIRGESSSIMDYISIDPNRISVTSNSYGMFTNSSLSSSSLSISNNMNLLTCMLSPDNARFTIGSTSVFYSNTGIQKTTGNFEIRTGNTLVLNNFVNISSNGDVSLQNLKTTNINVSGYGITTNNIEVSTFVIRGRTHSPNTAVGINSSGQLDWIPISSSVSGLITATNGITVTGGFTVNSGMEVINGISVYSGGITTNSLTSTGLIKTNGITTNNIETTTFVITNRSKYNNTVIGINSSGDLDWIPFTGNTLTSTDVLSTNTISTNTISTNTISVTSGITSNGLITATNGITVSGQIIFNNNLYSGGDSGQAFTGTAFTIPSSNVRNTNYTLSVIGNNAVFPFCIVTLPTDGVDGKYINIYNSGTGTIRIDGSASLKIYGGLVGINGGTLINLHPNQFIQLLTTLTGFLTIVLTNPATTSSSPFTLQTSSLNVKGLSGRVTVFTSSPMTINFSPNVFTAIPSVILTPIGGSNVALSAQTGSSFSFTFTSAPTALNWNAVGI
jgi:hypothetical protein